MTTQMKLPEGAPEEVITNALVRDIDLAAFGGNGMLALITLDNGHDHNRPNTFGPSSLASLDGAITDAISRKPTAIAITGKPFILPLAQIFQHFHSSRIAISHLLLENSVTMFSAV